MTKSFDIFIKDLLPEKRKEVLKFLKLRNPADGNYDVIPLAVIAAETKKGEKADEL